MLSPEQVAELPGAIVFDDADEELGAVEDVLPNPGDDEPAWAAVALEDRRVVVPLLGADFDGTEVRVPYGHDLIAEAPGVPEGDTIDPDTQTALYEHYRLTDADFRDDTGPAADRPVAEAPGLGGTPALDTEGDDDVGGLAGGHP